jgi:hypothetical protein
MDNKELTVRIASNRRHGSVLNEEYSGIKG